LDAAIESGGFTGYLASVAAWLDRETPDNPSRKTLVELLGDPAFSQRLAQYQLISKITPEELGTFARGGAQNRDFLKWLLADTKALDQYLIAMVPNGRERREANTYTLSTTPFALWMKIIERDPECKEDNIYRRMAIGISTCPPRERSWGKDAPIDPVQRYVDYKEAHKNGELFPIFETLTCWEMQKVLTGWATNDEVKWFRQMVNTWMPSLRDDMRVNKLVSQVWRRNSPFLYKADQKVEGHPEPLKGGFRSALAGGGKCGPRSWTGKAVCRAFGIPAIGVRQPHWKVVYGRGWHVSKADDVLVNVRGFGFVEEANLRSQVEDFHNIEHLRWLSTAVTDAASKEAILKAVAQIDGEAVKKPARLDAPEPKTSLTEEKPFPVTPGVIHVEAEKYVKSGKTQLQTCMTGGQQVHFGAWSEGAFAEYEIEVPQSGTYALTVRAAAVNLHQALNFTIGSEKPVPVPVALSYGLWETTKPVDFKLVAGKQKVRIHIGNQRGVTVRWFEFRKELDVGRGRSTGDREVQRSLHRPSDSGGTTASRSDSAASLENQVRVLPCC
jgi:hypothetical protein